MSNRDEADIAVIGGGLIGSSWAAHFLGRGLDVTVCDPAPGAEEPSHLKSQIQLSLDASGNLPLVAKSFTFTPNAKSH